MKILFLQVAFLLLPSVAFTQEAPILNGGVACYERINAYAASPQIIQNRIFKEQYGSASPIRAMKAMRGTANAEAIITSQTWKTYERGVGSVFGETSSTSHFLESQANKVRLGAKANNLAHTQSLNIKGDCAEAAMDAFYEKDGWEKLDGKRGRNGFDGLYVKRNAQGRVVQWIPVDAKAGSSKLSITQRGKQLSPEWIKANLEDLIQNAEAECMKSPTLANKQRLADLKALKTAKMRKPRIFSMKVKCVAGETHIVMQNADINGNPVSNPMDINMQSAKGQRARQRWLRQMENSMSAHGVKDASKLVKNMEADMVAGRIQSDSDLHQFLKRNVNNGKFRAETAKRFGMAYRGAPLVRPAGNIAKVMAWGAKTMNSPLGRVGMVALDPIGYSMERGLQTTSSYVAKQIYGTAGTKAAQQAASRMATQFVKFGTGGLVAVTGAYTLCDAYSRFNAGEMSQTAFLIESSTTIVATAGGVFLTCTEMGAAIGTAVCPGLGSAAGAVVGVLVAGVATGVNVLYMWYEGNERQELAKLEESIRNNADKEHDEARIKRIRQNAEEQIARGWQIFGAAM